MLCRLVAYQSCAIIEAGERGLATSFLEFEPTPQALSSVLGRDTVMVIRGGSG
jgi:hypothetical protein